MSVYLLPTELDEQEAKLHLPELGALPTVFARNTQIVWLSRLKALSRVTVTRSTTASHAQSLCCLSGCARHFAFLRGLFRIFSSPGFPGISGVLG